MSLIYMITDKIKEKIENWKRRPHAIMEERYRQISISIVRRSNIWLDNNIHCAYCYYKEILTTLLNILILLLQYNHSNTC